MKIFRFLALALLSLTLPAAAQIQRHPATPEDAWPNDPKVPILIRSWASLTASWFCG